MNLILLIAKLSDLEQSSVIQKVDKPTEWVSRMAISEKKSGDIRVCIDPQILNLALKRELHPLPIMDDILPELSNAKVFSKFDMRNGYWHCVLDELGVELSHHIPDSVGTIQMGEITIWPGCKL